MGQPVTVKPLFLGNELPKGPRVTWKWGFYGNQRPINNLAQKDCQEYPQDTYRGKVTDKEINHVK